MAAVLSSRVNNCLKLFKNLITNDELSRYHDEVPANLWQDELGRFRVWAANIGAHQVDQSSLDYRLRDASHIRDQISSLLVALQGTIKYLEEVVAENPGDYEEEFSDGEGTTEVQQIYSGLVDNINCLFRMSMLIRKPARHDRLLNFEKQDVVTYEQFDQQHVREKFPHANRVVSDRLGNAISRRRADLKYRERHHKKLGKGIDRLHDRGAPSTYMSETIASDISSKFKEESNIQFDERGSSAGLSQTSYAQTMLEGHQAMTIPPPPKESANDQPFECPYCFFITTITNRASWARHVFRDIMPYICTYPDCSTPNRLYDSRREWYGHLVSKHISSGPDTKHICSLCREESLSDYFLQRHLGRHLQELALFAIPRLDDDEEQDTDKVEDAFDPFQNSSVESEEDSGNDDDVIPDGSIQALKEQGGRRVPPKHQPSEDFLAAPTETPLLDLSEISLNNEKVSDYEEAPSQKVESNKAIVADPEVASTAEAASSKTDIGAPFHLLTPLVMHSKAGMEDETPREPELLPLNRLGDTKAMTRDEVLDRFFQDSRENSDYAEEANTDSPAPFKTTLGGAFEYNASEHTSTSSKSSGRRNRDSRRSQRSRGRDDYALARPISHELERSRVDWGSIDHEHDDEIIVRRDEREGGRGGDRQQEEITIRKNSRSPSPDSSYRAPSPLEAAIIYAPPIHREIIYHERLIDHDYETAPARIPSRAPSPSMPPPSPPRERSEERLYIGEGLHGATRDWAIVDVPPGTQRIRMDGVGDGSQEISWQRYNGVRRSKFMPNGNPSDKEYGSEVSRSLAGTGAGAIGPRDGLRRKEGEGLWTEITKDLVVKEAITQAGYEFEETYDFYYVTSYLKYEDVARLVSLSDHIKRARLRRIKELEWENRAPAPVPAVEERPRSRLAPESSPQRREPWYNEQDRYIEREVDYRGHRPPPPRR